ncbi:MAG: hypothetical protein HY343_01955 [Lentisphaerae bacterium]|nr:hypothetical protein [Lentisphaerota bacterium]
MIWTHSSAPTPLEGLWQAHVREQVDSVCRAPGRPGHAVALGVTEYLKGRSRLDGIRSEELLCIVCRALWSLGEEASARQLWEEKARAFGAGGALADLLLDARVPVALSAGLIGRRVVRAWASAVFRAETLWVVDMERLVTAAGTDLELAVFKALTVLMDGLGCVWDATQGEGVLGLRCLGRAAQRLCPGARGRRRRCLLQRDILGLIREKLEQRRLLKHWAASPQIVRLELL